MKNKLILLAFVAILLTLVGCQETDVVVAGGVKSFTEFVAVEELNATLTVDNYHQFNAPSGDFFALSTSPQTTNKDIYASIDVNPFVNAGLNTDALPDGYEVIEDRLIIYSDFTNEQYSQKNPSAVDVLKGLIKANRQRFGYHDAMDHFGIELGNGNMIEWAADLSTNDKDLVFVVEPSILVAAGLNPEAVEGWVYADVTVMDAQGNKSTVKKLLKPFDLP